MKNKIFIALILISISSKAQQIGIFSDTINFMSQDRILSCYVPTNYDSTIKYQLMVCLHGMGDNSNNYRNALINSLNWKTLFTNTIFICPDGGSDANKDFSTPSGDEEIIAKCIEYAKNHYTIDTNNIILQGFSLGGRSALKYGLDNPSKFKGLLLNTPAIQGLDDALNIIPTIGMYYNYANAPKIPIYITCGGADQIYVYTIDKILEILKKNDAVVKLVSVTGLNHSIPNSTYVSPCLSFFNDPSTAAYDLDIFEIDLPDRACNSLIMPKIYVRNLGSTNVTSFELNYHLNSINSTFNWSGNIGPYQHTLVTLPQLTADTGNQTLDVSIGKINTSHTDSLTANNQLTKSFIIATKGNPYPVFEGFEGNMDGWIFPITGSVFSWFPDNTVHHTGLASIAAFNTILMFYTNGDIESFLSPVINLTSVPNPKMAFDYAYNYHKYTPPYFTSDVVFADTLEISISLDCGVTFERLFKKGGADLATAQSPIVNPLSIQQCFFAPKSSEWQTEIIDLNKFANESNTIIKFSYISNMGGSINIDNINFSKDVSIENEKTEISLNIYPNPAIDRVYIDFTEKQVVKMQVFNMIGECVLQRELNNFKNEIDISSLSKGIYIIGISNIQGTIQKKLIKE